MKDAKCRADIPLLNIQCQNQPIQGKLNSAASAVIASGAFVLGQATQAFEKNFSEFIGAPFAAGVGSGTDALIFGLMACGVKPGDEVILPSFTFMSSALAVLHVGAIPVFCDIEYEFYTICPQSLQRAISKKTKAVMVVHLFGQTANMDAISAVCRKAKLKIIEDACQAHGATWKNKKAGMLGDAAAFSFYPTKNLGGLGDGGMLTTASRSVFEKTLQLRNLGRSSMAVTSYEEIGWTSRLDSLQAALLDIKLKHLEKQNQERRRLAANYVQGLKNLELGLPHQYSQAKHVYHLFVIRIPGKKRDDLKAYLAERGIRTGIYYEKAIHEQPILKKYKHRKLSLPITQRLSSEVLALPLYPGLKDRDQKYIISAIREFYL